MTRPTDSAPDGAPDGAPESATDSRTGGALREELRYQLEILALAAFAISQPLLDVFGRAPDVFVFHGYAREDIVAFALAVTFLPAIAVGAVAAVTRLAGRRVRRWVQTVIVAIGATIIGFQAGNELLARSITIAIVGVAAGLGAAILYRRFSVTGRYLRYASPACLFFLGLFVLGSPTGRFLTNEDVAAADVTADAATPIVVLYFDGLSTAALVDEAGGIDPARFPNFAGLGETSTWYRNYTTHAPVTWHALPASLSGNLPKPGTSPIVTDHPENLFTLLGGFHEVHAHEAVSQLCPSSVCGAKSRSRGTGGLRDDVVETWESVTVPGRSSREPLATIVEETVAPTREQVDFDTDVFWDGFRSTRGAPARYLDFLGGLGPSAVGRPRLDFIHVVQPHCPCDLYPSGARWDGGFWSVDEIVPIDGDAALESIGAFNRQAYLLQVGAVDHLVGLLRDRLEQLGTWDRSLVVVTADTGNPQAPRPEFYLAPLFVKAPGQTSGGVDDRNVQGIDLVPTIAAMIGVDIPWPVDGLAATSDTPRPREKLFADLAGEWPGIGEPQPIEGEVGLADLLESAPYWNRPAGAGADPLALYRVSDGDALVGSSVADLSVVGDSGSSVSVGGWDGGRRAIDLDADVLPGLVVGTMYDGDDGATVAVAVNGTVVAVRATFVDAEGRSRFVALVPEPVMRPGENRLEVFVAEGAEWRRVPVGDG